MINKTGLNYIQAASVDFHVGVKSHYFFGNMQSSFSNLVFSAKTFDGTFTYSEHKKTICIRQVLKPASSSGKGLIKGIIQDDCIIKDSNSKGENEAGSPQSTTITDSRWENRGTSADIRDGDNESQCRH